MLSPLADVSVLDQSGSPFFCAGAAGEVCAHTGVVSLVGTAWTGSSAVLSGWVDSSGADGSVSKTSSVYFADLNLYPGSGEDVFQGVFR